MYTVVCTTTCSWFFHVELPEFPYKYLEIHMYIYQWSLTYSSRKLQIKALLLCDIID